MDTSQYMSMFLEESMDNLQVLNESLLELEQEPDNTDKLNEIFRVAHTIKGMAATMGFNRMAELTHKMEDVLSEFREGKLQVTQKVVTVLFKCLDTLEQMVEGIDETGEENGEIEGIMEELEAIADNPDIINKENIEEQDEKDDVKGKEIITSKGQEKGSMKLNEYDKHIIQQAVEKGFNAYEIRIVLSENTLLKSARAFLIFTSLEDCGEITKSEPSTEEIENENFDFQINLVLISGKSKEEIMHVLMSISEVDEVVVQEVENLEDEVKEPKQEEKVEEKKEEPKIEQPKKVELKKEERKQKKNASKAVSHKKTHQSVRVDLERLDKFMNMVSELVIHRTRLEQISTNYKLVELNETLEQVARTTSDLQDLVMKIRMLPLDVVFNRFPRMIRDLSVELDKEINFEIKGQNTELDRTVIDEIGEPLIHLLRNAADHGVENKEKRIASGKSPEGNVKLVAYQEGTKAVIKVSDDGAGIDVESIRAKAERIGINTEGMPDSEIRNLIFRQGFSTNEKVTDVSGRGVGMDVVKTKITSLGGTVDMITELGKGTSFIIRLPLTLQIIQALLVKVGTETMAISLGYIDRVIDYDETKIKKTNNKEVIFYSGNVIPLVRVNKKLGIDSEEENRNYIVIVRVGEKVVGLLVDDLLGQQEIVIKPLGKTLKGLNEYIGATILGDGLVTLILDVGALI